MKAGCRHGNKHQMCWLFWKYLDCFIALHKIAADLIWVRLMYLVDVIQDFQNCQDAGSNEQAHLSPDVTWEKSSLLAAVDTQKSRI